MQLPQYKEAFQREQIDGEVLIELDEQILESDLQISSKIHRIRLMKLISGNYSADDILASTEKWLGVSNYIPCSTEVALYCMLHNSFEINSTVSIMITIFLVNSSCTVLLCRIPNGLYIISIPDLYALKVFTCTLSYMWQDLRKGGTSRKTLIFTTFQTVTTPRPSDGYEYWAS